MRPINRCQNWGGLVKVPNFVAGKDEHLLQGLDFLARLVCAKLQDGLSSLATGGIDPAMTREGPDLATVNDDQVR